MAELSEIPILIARSLKEPGLSSCDVREQIGEETALMDLWKSADRVVVVDAVQSGVVPGTNSLLSRQLGSFASANFS